MRTTCEVCGSRLGYQRVRFCSRDCRVESTRNKPEMIWERARREGECVVYTGQRHDFGHGVIKVAGKHWGVHRLAWVLTHGPIPEGMAVCHHCDNPPCINPNHLFLGTIADNNQDRHRKGRYARPERCVNGHSFDQGNTHVRRDGSRECRTCMRLRTSAYRAREVASRV